MEPATPACVHQIPQFYVPTSKDQFERIREYISQFWQANHHCSFDELKENHTFSNLLAKFLEEFPLIFGKNPATFLSPDPSKLPEEDIRDIAERILSRKPNILPLHIDWSSLDKEMQTMLTLLHQANPPNLFMSDYRDNSHFRKIIDYAPEFNCHGVQQAKGGLKSLFNIMIDGVVFARWVGRLMNGNDPTFYATPHGPFFVIIEDSSQSIGKHCAYLFKSIAAYLVPGNTERTEITKALDKAIVRQMITIVQKQAIMKKLITYAEMAEMPPKAFKDMQIFKSAVAKLQQA